MFKTLSGLFASFERPQRIYVMPTKAGVLMLLMNLFLILMSAVYSSPSVQLLGFFLFALYGLGMTWTHASLRKLSKLGLSCEPMFAGDLLHAEIFGFSKLKEPRAGIELQITCSRRGEIQTFASTKFDLQVEGDFRHRLMMTQPLRRGRWALLRLRLQTKAPFGLFRAWIRIPTQSEDLVVYPQPKPFDLSRGSEGALPQERSPATNEEDFASLFESSKIDRANHVVPRPLNNESMIILKKFESSSSGVRVLKWSELPGDEEAKLSYCAGAAKSFFPGLLVETPFYSGKLQTPGDLRRALTAWAEA
jgi:hypothetical protein